MSFGADGELVFRSLEEKRNSLVRIEHDGSGLARITDRPINNKFGVSPDGGWVIVHAPAVSEDGSAETIAIPVHGGASRKVCPAFCPADWSPDGNYFSIALQGRALLIPVAAARSLPDLPASGINLRDPTAGLPAARLIEHGFPWLGRDPSTYVFLKTDLQRNLFRIPLH